MSGRAPSLGAAIRRVTLAWLVFVLVTLVLRSRLGADAAAGWACAAALATALPGLACRAAHPAADAVGGLLAGIAAYPLLGALLVHVGAFLGLFGTVADTRSAAWLVPLLLGPALEESLYRGWLLPALRVRTGPALAVLLSSLAFAAPHPGAWARLAALEAGLALGTARVAGGSLALCVGLHAGLNAGWHLQRPLAAPSNPPVPVPNGTDLHVVARHLSSRLVPPPHRSPAAGDHL